MRLTKAEQETVINFDNSTQTASIYTASPQMMRKLDALAKAYPEHYRITARRGLGQMNTAAEYSQKKVGELEKKRRESDSMFIRLYEDLSKKLISEEQFRLLSAHFEQEKKEYTEEIEKLNTMAENLEDSTYKAEQLANEMAECAEIKELTTAIVNRLIEKIAEILKQYRFICLDASIHWQIRH